MGKNESLVYRCRSGLIPGQNFKKVAKVARKIFNEIKSKSKRRPYIRSPYFKGAKIFLDNFWPHLWQKGKVERVCRLKLFQCSIELIQKSKHSPIFQRRDQSGAEKLYRFLGQAGQNFFIVQIKEDLKRGQKFFMSTFEYTKK